MKQRLTLGMGALLLATNAHAANPSTISSVSGTVTVTPKSAPAREARVGMTLADGSELTGGAGDAGVQIDCPNHATQTLSGEFDAVIDAEDPKKGCVVNLRAGTAVATTGNRDSGPGPAAITGGAVTMASQHTQFGLIVSKDPSKSQGEGFVVDGEATLNQNAAHRSWFVTSGSKIDGDTGRILAIDADRYQSIAIFYARLDISQPGVNAQADETRLRARWRAVLEHPEDPTARVELVEMQDRDGSVKSGIFSYELKRAVALASGSNSDDLKGRAKKLAKKYEIGSDAPNAPGAVAVH